MDSFWQLPFITLLAFACEFMDSTLGMGYGTTLTPVFLLMGFGPMEVVPIILLSELVTGISAGFFHHRQGNVNFKPKSTNPAIIIRHIRQLGYVESFRRGIPRHLKVALVLGACSILGTVAAVFVAINISKFWLKMYIGLLVLAMGIIILICLKKNFRFSWRKIVFLGAVASFNKGMSGGGYGPVVTSGQILSGVESQSAIGITSLAEGLTCFVGIVTYLLVLGNSIDFHLAPWVLVGALVSVPFSAKSVKFIGGQKLKLIIAVMTIFLGILTITKTLLST